MAVVTSCDIVWLTCSLAPQAAGNPGKRFAMKNTRIMMTQPMGEQGGWGLCARQTLCLHQCLVD